MRKLTEALRVFPQAFEIKAGIVYSRPGQTSADQELLLIFPESRGPTHISVFLVVYGKTQEIYNNILVLVIRSKIKFHKPRTKYYLS
jgi:hypothetical protein